MAPPSGYSELQRCHIRFRVDPVQRGDRTRRVQTFRKRSAAEVCRWFGRNLEVSRYLRRDLVAELKRAKERSGVSDRLILTFRGLSLSSDPASTGFPSGHRKPWQNRDQWFLPLHV
jgi:hypothetical protein